MPEINLESLGLDNMTAGELELKRRDLVTELRTKWGDNLDEAPIEMLHQLAQVTSTLRRRNAGPPKTPKVKKGAKKTVDDLLSQL